MMEVWKITQIKSSNSATKRQLATLAALGIRRMSHSVEKEATPVIRGMVEKVRHMVSVEEVK
ncbi:MAG: 50S ribosomal protein L30 [Bacteroidales bacterium]|nr:50S ribosomal protein L30 [Bacteroidales bacterium]